MRHNSTWKSWINTSNFVTVKVWPATSCPSQGGHSRPLADADDDLNMCWNSGGAGNKRRQRWFSEFLARDSKISGLFACRELVLANLDPAVGVRSEVTKRYSACCSKGKCRDSKSWPALSSQCDLTYDSVANADRFPWLASKMSVVDLLIPKCG